MLKILTGCNVDAFPFLYNKFVMYLVSNTFPKFGSVLVFLVENPEDYYHKSSCQ